MEKATLTSKGQLTIPKPVRDRLGLKPGDRVLFDIDDETVRLHVQRRHTVGELFDQLHGANRAYPGRDNERAAARKHVAEQMREE